MGGIDDLPHNADRLGVPGSRPVTPDHLETVRRHLQEQIGYLADRRADVARMAQLARRTADTVGMRLANLEHDPVPEEVMNLGHRVAGLEQEIGRKLDAEPVRTIGPAGPGRVMVWLQMPTVRIAPQMVTSESEPPSTTKRVHWEQAERRLNHLLAQMLRPLEGLLQEIMRATP